MTLNDALAAIVVGIVLAILGIFLLWFFTNR